jgi:hypothetical protein
MQAKMPFTPRRDTPRVIRETGRRDKFPAIPPTKSHEKHPKTGSLAENDCKAVSFSA